MPPHFIPLQLMPHQVDAGPEDDWTGVTDPKVRKLLQDRVNQRASRQRKKARDASCPQEEKDEIHVLSPSTKPRLSSHIYLDDQSRTGPFSSRDILDCSDLQPWSKKIDSFTACEPDSERTEQFILQFSNWALQNYLKGSPRTDILLSLVQFNVTRALVMNAKLLGLTSETMARGARSHIASAGINHVTFSNALPSSLLPTSLQRTVPHHPWIDLLPVPELRDNILRQGENSPMKCNFVEI